MVEQGYAETVRAFFDISSTLDEFFTINNINEANVQKVKRIIQEEASSSTVQRKQHLLSILIILTTYDEKIKQKIKLLSANKHQHIGGGSVGDGVASTSNGVGFPARVKYVEVDSAFKSRIVTGTILNLNKNTLPKEFLFRDCSTLFKEKLDHYVRKFKSLKCNVILVAIYCKTIINNKREELTTATKYFNTKNYPINIGTDVKEIFTEMCECILTEMENFETSGSGWTFKEILHLNVNLNKFSPMGGGSYIDLPIELKKISSKPILNIKCNDRKCFVWCILSKLTNIVSERVNDYPQNYHDFLNLHNITLPVSIKDLSRFERQNPTISVNVFGYDKKKKTLLGPYYHTKAKKQYHVNLLYLTKNHSSTGHYCLIRKLSALCKDSAHAKFVCDRCLIQFRTKDKFTEHEINCELTEHPVKIEMPNEDFIKFKNFQNSIKHEYVIYADLESICFKINNNGDHKNDNNKPFSFKYAKHVPYSVAYQIVCSFDKNLNKFRTYAGSDCISWFITQIRDDVITLSNHLKSLNVPMSTLTFDQQNHHDNLTNCPFCNRLFDCVNVIKVKDHSHVTGQYRYTLCAGCNLNYRQKQNYIPLFFHNNTNYDSKFIIQHLTYDTEEITVIPLNKEKYLSFAKKILPSNTYLRFLDSMRFLPASIQKLAETLGDNDFHFLREAYPVEHEYQLLKRKGVFCYDYMDCFSKLHKTRLPKKIKFRSTLTNETDISDDDYAYAQRVWNVFNCKTILDYSNIYLKVDVIILCDVFENFRNLCLNLYELDPVYYYTTANFSYDCMLKISKVELEYLKDYDMILFIEKGIRGGLSQASKRYAKANNPYMGAKLYDKNTSESYIVYFDINNLYGFAMRNLLPVSNFEWVHEDYFPEIEQFILNRSCKSIVTDGIDNLDYCNGDQYGYILEVDLSYPENLFESHKDLPLLPHKYIPDNSKYHKLIVSLLDRQNYVIHYTLLIQCLNLGMKLTRIHRILKFKQSHWLKEYVDLNTSMRVKAKTTFERDLYKNMVNVIYGKSIQDIRKHRNIKLVRKWEGKKGAEGYISLPTFHSATIFNENLVAIELNKTKIFYNKAIYVGMSILDISKCLFYDYYYNYFRKALNTSDISNRLDLIYCDTDSLIFHIFCSDFYSIIRRDNNNIFDTSDYPADNIFNIKQMNGRKLGYIKDELKGNIIHEFVALKSKMYAFLSGPPSLVTNSSSSSNNDSNQKILLEKKRAKGVGKFAVAKLAFNQYKEALFDGTVFYSKFNKIQSEKMCVYSMTVCKKSLDNFDDKRIILEDNIHTVPWGYTKL